VPDVIRIGTRAIGTGHRVFIIAEAGVNHNGDLGLAKRLVSVAKDAGADAVKFQTFAADRLVTPKSPKAQYQRETADAKESQYEMLKKLELSPEEHQALMAHARACDLVFLSTPFDKESADLLEKLGVPAFKIGSGELTDLPLLQHVARKGKPMILSTGMSTMEEVEQAVQAVQKEGLKDIALLHCVSAYPAPVEDVNMRAMHILRETFNMPVGYSDHTKGTHVAPLAVACGACIIEKHLTLDQKLPGPDHRMSMEPDKFAKLVRRIREAEIALGDGKKQSMPSEKDTRAVARKSVVALVDITQGFPLERAMLGVKRPGTGIAPADLESLIGRKLRVDVQAGEVLLREMLYE
jgi:N-acetylneuraminate synthase/N,N'-diacetyllegionaminate synthase